MIGRRATVGFALLCALMFSAFAAQSAMAQKGTKAVNTTAFTCVENGGQRDFSDSHCDTFVGAEKGKFGHVAIPLNETTEIEVTNQAGTVPFFKGTLFKLNTEIECKKAASVAKKSFIHNVETIVETKKQHTVTGEVQINFTECTVKAPAKCKIKEPIVTTATFEGVEGLKREEEKKEKKEEMGVLFKGVGEKATFTELNFEPAECPLIGGNPFLIQGSAIATGTPEPSKANKHSGATSLYKPNSEKEAKEELEMQTLEIGGNKKQYFTASFTTRMAGGGNPISLTTVT